MWKRLRNLKREREIIQRAWILRAHPDLKMALSIFKHLTATGQSFGEIEMQTHRNSVNLRQFLSMIEATSVHEGRCTTYFSVAK